MTNEMKVLREFVQEFHPYYATMVNDFTYDELISIVKEIAEEF